MARFTQPERELIMCNLPATAAQLEKITGLSEQKVRDRLRTLEKQKAIQVVGAIQCRNGSARIYGWYTGVPFKLPVVNRFKAPKSTWVSQLLR